MNKHVLALSTALTILAFTPALAQKTTPAIDCTQQANANDPACANQQTQSQDQNAQGSTTTTTTTPTQDQNAQGSTTTTTDPNATQQQTGQTGTEGTDAGTGSTVTTTTTGGSGASGGQMSQSELIVPADQLNNAQVMSANDYIGKTVYDQAGNDIGEVNDLIVSGDGTVEAVILGVGGFLGIGEKDVAVNTQAVQMVQDGDNTRLVVQATKEALESAPSYDKSNRRYADQTTGSGTTTDQTGTTTTAPATNATGAGETGSVDCKDPANASDPACATQNQQNQQNQQQ